MSYRPWVLLICLLALLLVPACGRGPHRVFDDGPRRIIVVSLDTLSAKHLASYGYHRETAPGLSAMAVDGIRFEHVTAPSNWTLPSHVSLFTGLYPARHGVLTDQQALDDGPAHLTETLREAGFATAAFTGGAYLHRRHGMARGFDHYESEGRWDHNTAVTLEKAGRWLREHREQDVFVFLHTYEIHAPYTAPSDYVKRFAGERLPSFRGKLAQIQEMKKRGVPTPEEIEDVVNCYDAGILWTDDLLTTFLDSLAADGLADNTLLIVSSDHGEEFWEHGEHSHGDDMLGDEVTQVPLFVRLPGRHAAGSVVEAESSFLDIMPTVLDAAGLERPPGIDGCSLMPEIVGWDIALGERDARARRLLEPGASTHAVGICEGTHYTAARTRDWKAVVESPDGRPAAHDLWPALFDLQADPGEQSPLAVGDGPWAQLTGAVDRLCGSGRGQGFEPPEDVVVDEATREQLKALGY